jgi:hypothetical protein
MNRGVTEKLFITEAGPSTALDEVGDLLLTNFQSAAGSEPITAAEVTIASTEEGTLAQVIRRSPFSSPSHDPAGVTYLPRSDHFSISASGVEETAIGSSAPLLTQALSTLDATVAQGSDDAEEAQWGR